MLVSPWNRASLVAGGQGGWAPDVGNRCEESSLEDSSGRRVLLGWPWNTEGLFRENNEKLDFRSQLQFASWRFESLAVPGGLGRSRSAIGVLHGVRASRTPAFHQRVGGILDLDLDPVLRGSDGTTSHALR